MFDRERNSTKYSRTESSDSTELTDDSKIEEAVAILRQAGLLVGSVNEGDSLVSGLSKVVINPLDGTRLYEKERPQFSIKRANDGQYVVYLESEVTPWFTTCDICSSLLEAAQSLSKLYKEQERAENPTSLLAQVLSYLHVKLDS